MIIIHIYNKCFIEPTSGFFFCFILFPRTSYGVIQIKPLCGFKEKILKGFNLNNRGCKPVANRTM
jgi:hypothetical protein